MKQAGSNTSIYDTTIRLFLMLLIIAWCLMIMYPFVSIILWSLILVLAMYPAHKKLSGKMGGKPRLASVIIILAILVVVVVPTWLLISSLVDEFKVLKASYDSGALTIPRPSEKIKEWPLIGNTLYDTWVSASGNISQFLMKYKDQLIQYGTVAAKGVFSAISGIIQILISLVIAGILLSIGGTADGILKFLRKVSGSRGDEFASMILKTVSSVVNGILGESLVMAILNGTVFMLAGVPFAGIWTFLVFIFAVLQIPVVLITIPIVIYLFFVKSVLAAVLWTILLLLISLSDNILTPLMLGKGAPVPMVVIFVGVIGGFAVFGFIGLFTGAIVLSLGYKLFLEWINSGKNDNPDDALPVPDE